MTSLSRLLLIAASLVLAACSLYESQDRKSLENNAFSIANGTAHFNGCTENPALQDEKYLSEDSHAWIYQKSNDPSEVRVLLKGSNLACQYQFINEQAVSSHLDAIVHDALVRHTTFL